MAEPLVLALGPVSRERLSLLWPVKGYPSIRNHGLSRKTWTLQCLSIFWHFIGDVLLWFFWYLKIEFNLAPWRFNLSQLGFSSLGWTGSVSPSPRHCSRKQAGAAGSPYNQVSAPRMVKKKCALIVFACLLLCFKACPKDALFLNTRGLVSMWSFRSSKKK